MLGRHLFWYALVAEVAVGHLDIFDEIAGSAEQQRRGAPGGIARYDVGDRNAAHRAGAHRLLGTAIARAQPQKQGDVERIAERDVGDGNVFSVSAIDGLNRQSARTLADAVRNGDIAKSAI